MRTLEKKGEGHRKHTKSNLWSVKHLTRTLRGVILGYTIYSHILQKPTRFYYLYDTHIAQGVSGI